MKNSYFYKIFLFANFFCLIFPFSSTISATWAIVKSDKANVYSDIEMSSVIGFIKRGKKIRVGEVPKNKGKVLPLILNKRVVYIEVKNIQYGDKIDTTRSVLQKYKDKELMSKPIKRIALFSGTYIGFIDNEGFDEELSEDLIFITAGMRGYYNNLSSKSSYRVSLSSSIAQEKDALISFLDIAIAKGLGGLKSKYLDFIFFGGPVIAPYVEYKQGDDFKITGQALGLEAGAEIRFSMSSRMSFHLGANYQYLKFFNMDLPDNNFYPEEFDSHINGVKILGTLSYSY